MEDGTVQAWGSNLNGQLGDGTTTTAATLSHSLALKTDGTVRAWGGNDEGQLGDGTETDRNTPVQVQNLSEVQTIAAGGSHSLAKVKPAVAQP